MEVGNKFLRAVTALQKGFAVFQLLGNGQSPVGGTEANVVAIDAAARGDAPVAVRAGKTRIDRDLLNSAAEHMPQMGCIAHVTG